MNGTYSIVRPYSGILGEQIEALMTTLDLTPALGQPPAAGTPDEFAARWASRSTAQLLVVPFHYHRGTAQDRLDGIGVLLSLPSSFSTQGRVLFMPVRDFSWSTSFAPRFEILRKKKREIAEKLIVIHEGELDSAASAIRLRRALETARDQRSRPPAPLSRRRPGSITPAMRPSASERFSSEPNTKARRASGAWKFSLPPDPATPTVPPISGARAIRDTQPNPASSIVEDSDEKKAGGGE